MASAQGLTFTCFDKLPTELRLKIWGLVCGETRDVDILFGLGLGRQQTYYEIMRGRFVSTVMHPAILHTSHESRAEGLKHYKLGFGLTASEDSLEDAEPKIYINPDADRVHVTGPLTVRTPWVKIRDLGVRHVAYSFKIWQDHAGQDRDFFAHDLLQHVLIRGTKVEEVVLYKFNSMYEIMDKGDSVEMLDFDPEIDEDELTVKRKKIKRGIYRELKRIQGEWEESPMSHRLQYSGNAHAAKQKLVVPAFKFMDLKVV